MTRYRSLPWLPGGFARALPGLSLSGQEVRSRATRSVILHEDAAMPRRDGRLDGGCQRRPLGDLAPAARLEVVVPRSGDRP